MASFTVRHNGYARALVRMQGKSICATLPNRTQATAWANREETRLKQT
jgi:hypothetical protein